MFYFRINKVRIIDNRENAFLFFTRDLAEIKLVSLITTGNTSFPDLDPFLAETNPEKKKQLAAAMVAQVVSNRILATIDNVKDGQTINFGDTGYVVFQANTIPQDFNWCFIALEDDGDVRNVGSSIDEVLKNPGFDMFATNLAVLAGAAANPAFTAGVVVAKFVASVIADNLKKNKDDLAGLLYMSLNRREHYQHGIRDRDDVADLTGNMIVDYSLFGFE
ncbi:MAG: hypothetical protein GY845_12730 [Planctomycetes bacterium]|nr:hypothetical protein [Planctomycetota bacterium]